MFKMQEGNTIMELLKDKKILVKRGSAVELKAIPKHRIKGSAFMTPGRIAPKKTAAK